MKSSDVIAICSVIVALASGVSEPALETVAPGHGAYIAGVLALLGLSAGQIIRVLTNKTGQAQATSLAVHADGNIPVVNAASGASLGTVVTTTSTNPIIAPTVAPVPPPGVNPLPAP